MFPLNTTTRLTFWQPAAGKVTRNTATLGWGTTTPLVPQFQRRMSPPGPDVLANVTVSPTAAVGGPLMPANGPAGVGDGVSGVAVGEGTCVGVAVGVAVSGGRVAAATADGVCVCAASPWPGSRRFAPLPSGSRLPGLQPGCPQPR